MAHQSKKLMNIVIVNKSTSDDLSILGLDDIELKFNSVVNVKTFGENVFLIDLSKMTSTACSSGIFLYKDKLKSSYSLCKIVKKINNNVLISPLHICNDKYITVTTLDLISLNEFKQNLYKLSISNEKSILKMHKKSFLNVILYLNEKNEVNINLENFDYFNLENEGNIYPFKVLNEVKDSVILFGNTNDLQLLIDLDFVLNRQKKFHYLH